MDNSIKEIRRAAKENMSSRQWEENKRFIDSAIEKGYSAAEISELVRDIIGDDNFFGFGSTEIDY